MSTGAKIGVVLGILIALSALAYVIYKLTKKDSSNCASGFTFVNGVCVPVETTNNGTGSGSNNTGGNNTQTPPPPSPPATTNWTDFKTGDRVFAVQPVDAWDRDTLGTHGYYGKVIKTFQPNAYIGTVSAVIPNHGLMLKNTHLANPYNGDPFFILGLNSLYRKG